MVVEDNLPKVLARGCTKEHLAETLTEYEELGALRRAAAAKKKKEARLDVKNKREPYINSALPYVDARRVEAAIYRPASKDGARWNY